MRSATVCAGFSAAVCLSATMTPAHAQQSPAPGTPRLVTGKSITPTGSQAQVGSMPANVVLSPDGQYLIVSSLGDRAFVTSVRVSDSKVVGQAGFNGAAPGGGRGKAGLYYGLAFGTKAADGTTPVYAARGSDHLVSILTLSADGSLVDTGKTIDAGSGMVSGLAADAAGRRIYAASNVGDPSGNLSSVVQILDTQTLAVQSQVTVAGYPYSITAITTGPLADKKVFAASEQRGSVSDIDPAAGKVTKDIPTGDHPLGLLLNRAQDRLFVCNAGSDTVSIVRTADDSVEKTILLRPSEERGLPGATPSGAALSPDEKTLYVTLSDMNAVAVVNIAKGEVSGYIPVGWYPTAIVASPDGNHLFVTNAKGVVVRTPNDKPVAVAVAAKERRSKYIQNILEGTLSTIDLADATKNLAALTAQTLANNRIVPNLSRQAQTALSNPGIKHVIYIIKENRTYDQVLGDETEGNGDPSQLLFGRKITPNLHALAERFALMDDFYCCAEVSGDGWNWSTAATANPYVIRNVPYGYTDHEHPYDYEGTNNGVAADRKGIPDVGRPAGGYLWDGAAQAHVSMRNYGFFVDDLASPRKVPEEGPGGGEMDTTKTILVPVTDTSYRGFDTDYADSDAYVKFSLPIASREKKTFGKFGSTSRFTEWKREFDQYVAKNNLPQLEFVRLGNDHTGGTSEGRYSPSAMVADNDYAVGELVDTVSHSPYWKSTAIFVVEDDAQSGNDHVDAHRSPGFVISPFVKQATHDSRFYNTDSMLHSMENLLGIRPLCQYDATAPTFGFFTATPDNDAPYSAIAPDPKIVAEVNEPFAYRSKDSARFFPTTMADSGPDSEMSDIVWHAVKGAKTPLPVSHVSMTAPGAKKDRDDDDK